MCNFKQYVLDGIDLIDLIEILGVTPEAFYSKFETEIEIDNRNKITEFLGLDELMESYDNDGGYS